jgi:tRNA-dihydrouridine synthase B
VFIGPHEITGQVLLAPMAGVSDLPFRRLAIEFGAAMAVSEMISSNPRLANTRKSRLRQQHFAEAGIRAVQIVGTEAQQMAESARLNADNGAQIIDINMGCPAKKVCKKAAGSALLRDENKVAEILRAVVNAVELPVTLKIRTGWAPDERNAVTIARIAESEGIRMLAVHGRTRACAFRGDAEYETIASVKQAVALPVIANGDIDSPRKARAVLDFTRADGVMIGRAAQGNPWLIRQINDYLTTGAYRAPPNVIQVTDTMASHLHDIHKFYGETTGVRISRKHLGWYCKLLPHGERLKAAFNAAQSALEQYRILGGYVDQTRQDQMGIAA